jgi:hypothetical protein
LLQPAALSYRSAGISTSLLQSVSALNTPLTSDSKQQQQQQQQQQSRGDLEEDPLVFDDD